MHVHCTVRGVQGRLCVQEGIYCIQEGRSLVLRAEPGTLVLRGVPTCSMLEARMAFSSQAVNMTVAKPHT